MSRWACQRLPPVTARVNQTGSSARARRPTPSPFSNSLVLSLFWIIFFVRLLAQLPERRHAHRSTIFAGHLNPCGSLETIDFRLMGEHPNCHIDAARIAFTDSALHGEEHVLTAFGIQPAMLRSLQIWFALHPPTKCLATPHFGNAIVGRKSYPLREGYGRNVLAAPGFGEELGDSFKTVNPHALQTNGLALDPSRDN